MATPRYWSANYWEANYWDTEYWAAATGGEIIGSIGASTTLAPSGVVSGDYWATTYWGSNYWSSGYWADGGVFGNSTFVGSFTPSVGVNGTISSTLQVNPAAFVGSTTQVELFDLDVSFTVQWTFTEASTFTGTIANTLEANASAITGQFSEDFTGTIGTTLSESPANFDGTHVAPSDRSGVITTQLSNEGFEGVGLVVDPDGFTGSIAASTDVSSAITGQYITSNTDGSIGVTLDDVTPAWRGNYFSADTVVGTFLHTLNGHTLSFTGTMTRPESWVDADDDTTTWTVTAADDVTWTVQ